MISQQFAGDVVQLPRLYAVGPDVGCKAHAMLACLAAAGYGRVVADCAVAAADPQRSPDPLPDRFQQVGQCLRYENRPAAVAALELTDFEMFRDVPFSFCRCIVYFHVVRLQSSPFWLLPIFSFSYLFYNFF